MKKILTLLISFAFLSLTGYSIDGPKTTAAVVSTPCQPSTFIEVQVTVTDFNNVGSINNRLLYDANILDFESVDFNAVLSTPSIDYDASTDGVFELGYFTGTGMNLSNGATLYTLKFSYDGPPGGGYTALTWPEFPETANDYGDPNGIPFDKDPFNDFYFNGSVTIGPTICDGPVTTVNNVSLTCVPAIIEVPVTVTSFNNVSSISNTLNYNASYLQYVGVQLNPAILTGFYYTNGTNPGTFVMGFSKIPGISLPNGAVLYTLQFNYIGPPGGGSTTLTWPDSPPEANEYSDANSTPYYKVPFGDYFKAGTVTVPPFICNGPVTDVAEVTLDCRPSPILVPVTVTSFNNVSSISNTLNYDAGYLQYAGVQLNPAILTGFYYTNGTTPGVFVMGFSKIPGISLPDGAVLYTLQFNYVGPPGGGSTTLTWPDSPTEANEYSNANSTPFYKIPFGDYFKSGTITVPPYLCNGPVTDVAEVNLACLSQPILVPVTVTSFNNVSSISNTLNYNASYLQYVGVQLNPAILTGFYYTNGTTPGTFVMGFSKIPGISLPDGAVLYTLQFNYIGPPGGVSTTLTWPDSPTEANEYSDANSTPFYKVPFGDYFKPGTVTVPPYICNGPVTTIEDVDDACPSFHIFVPVTVTSFNNVSSISHTVNYDEDFMQYIGVALNPVLLTGYNYTNGTTPGVFVMGFSKIPGISLIDGETLYTLEFAYTGPPAGGTTTLEWQDSPTEANEYSDANSTPYYKLPFDDYFIKGEVTVDPLNCPPDITPIITVSPSVMNGPTSFTIKIEVEELNLVATSGLITVILTKDPRWVISGTFSDPVWSYSGGDPNYHVFTTSSSIAGGTKSSFVINASWSAGQTTGQFTITSTIASPSGGEVRDDNNSDAERIDYFIN